jgi:hypothetical protein
MADDAEVQVQTPKPQPLAFYREAAYVYDNAGNKVAIDVLAGAFSTRVPLNLADAEYRNIKMLIDKGELEVTDIVPPKVDDAVLALKSAK